MKKELLRALCDTVHEVLTKNELNIGPKGQAFLDVWQQELSKESGACQTQPTSLAPDMTDLAAGLPSMEEVETLRNERKAAREHAQRLEKQNQECLQFIKQLEKENQTYRQEIQREQEARRAACAQAEQARDLLEKSQQTSLPEQKELEALHTYLRSLPQDVCRLLDPYYDRSNLLIFLVSCGQFTRLVQCWEACSKAVVNGTPSKSLEQCLRTLLELYNCSAQGALATVVEPKPGDHYDYETSLRVASDGTIVQRLLLSGLRNPGGKLMHKALVQLR